MTICAAMNVFNEERRIESTLRSFSWCDEILILDKQSTDRTTEIARNYTNKIITIPWKEYRTEENQIALDNITSDWILGVTASDMIHPNLAMQILEITEKKDFPYDVIHIPFRRYVLGLETPRSPWYSELNACVFRKAVAKINYNSVHGALYFDTDRHYKMQKSNDYCMYHLTHETMEKMMDRHMLYWRADALKFPPDNHLKNAFAPILRNAYKLVVRRKTWLMGWDGIALAMAFMSYWMLQFVYIWEKLRCHAPQTYKNIRNDILQAWTDFEASKINRK